MIAWFSRQRVLFRRPQSVLLFYQVPEHNLRDLLASEGL